MGQENQSVTKKSRPKTPVAPAREGYIRMTRRQTMRGFYKGLLYCYKIPESNKDCVDTTVIAYSVNTGCVALSEVNAL